jgi:hypothetical protein
VLLQQDLGLNGHEPEPIVDSAHPHVLVVAACPDAGRSVVAGDEERGDLDCATKTSPSVLGEDQRPSICAGLEVSAATTRQGQAATTPRAVTAIDSTAVRPWLCHSEISSW